MGQSPKFRNQELNLQDNPHFDSYLQYVRQYGDRDMGEQVGGGFAGHREKLEEKKEGIIQAVRWGLVNAPVQTVGLVEKITTFLLDAGHWRERREFCRRALEIARNEQLIESEIGLLTRLGWSDLILWDYENARKQLEETRKIAEQIETRESVRERLVQIERDLAHVYSLEGNFEAAFALYDLSEQRARDINQEFGIVWAETHRARTQYLTGDPHLISIAEQTCLALSQRLSAYPRQLLIVFKVLTRIALAKNELDKAEDYLQQAEAALKLKQFYQALEEVHIYLNWGDLHTRRNDFAEAI